MRRLGRAAAAGVAGALAYLGAQEIDRRIVNPRSNDLVLIGGIFTSSRSITRGLLGLALHVLGGVSLGLAFEAFVARRLCGPYWLRGIVMVQVESAMVFPAVLLFDRTHPAVKSGELAPLARPVYFAQQVWRHLALGAVIGAVLGPDAARGSR